MFNRKATATTIKHRIIRYVSTHGSLLPGEIYTQLRSTYPHNHDNDFKVVVKEMIKENILIPDIIYGGLQVQAPKL